MKISYKKFLGFIFIICVLFVLYYMYNNYSKSYNLKYTQEYIPNNGNIKGNVNISSFLKYSEKFEIGANKYGYAVFKNPDIAFDEMQKLFADGINSIQSKYKLKKLTKSNWKLYKVYGMQLNGVTEKEIEQAKMVSKFLDIYENSFENK